MRLEEALAEDARQAAIAAVERTGRAPLHIRQRERVEEQRRAFWRQRDRAAEEVEAIHEANRWRPIDGYSRDGDLYEAGDRYAGLMSARITTHTDGGTTPEVLREAIAADVWHLAAYEFATNLQLPGIIARVSDAVWWSRPLGRLRTKLREWEGMQRGEVRQGRQPYVTDDTAERHRQREERNRAILAAAVIESQDGEEINLLQAVEASPAHKPIRRGELMTRIRGCEEAAETLGMVGLFTTNTAPSRFHPQLHGGGDNPKHDGATARDAQRWLCRTWERCRSALGRLGVAFFGFRVAEPHHDGCPHWHMLLWCRPADAIVLRETMRRYWLAEELAEVGHKKRAPLPLELDARRALRRRVHAAERGAWKHRFNAKRLRKGGATAYVAKYIAKNIDDVGSVGEEGHRDEWANPQQDAFGGKAQRVAAWASAHGIRQFQPLGQPPVTVWRELRRVGEQQRKGAFGPLDEACKAVHRDGEKRADWFAYMRAQGGPMVGRAYRVRLAKREETREGRYETTTAEQPIGVEYAGVLLMSARRRWKPAGTWRQGEREALAAPALSRSDARLFGLEFRTAQPAALGPVSLTVRADLDGTRRGPLKVWLAAIREQEPGAVLPEETPWTPPPTPPTPPGAPPPTSQRTRATFSTSLLGLRSLRTCFGSPS